MLYNLFIQSLAILFLIASAVSFHVKSKKGILIAQIVGISLLALHFLLLEAWSGFAMQFILVFAVSSFLFKEKHKSLLVFFILLFVVFTYITWQGYFSIFAFLGITLALIAKWQVKTRLIRIISIPSGISWIIYDMFVYSYGGIISESILLVSVLLSLMFKWKIMK